MGVLVKNKQGHQTPSLVLDIQILERLTFVGLLGSVMVIVCNSTLYFHGDISDWPQWALNLSYWGGSAAIALIAVAFIPTYVALRSAGRFWSSAPSLMLAYFTALGSAGHGSFFANYSVRQMLVRSESSGLDVQALEVLLPVIETYNGAIFGVCLFFLFFGSLFYSLAVIFKTTLYSRWMALWNPFAISLLTTSPSFISTEPSFWRSLSLGVGFHLALIGHFLLTRYVLRKSALSESTNRRL